MKMRTSKPAELYKSLLSSVKRSCIKHKSLANDLNHYGLNVEDVDILFQTVGEDDQPRWNRLQRGKENRVSVIVSMRGSRIEPVELRIDIDLLKERYNKADGVSQ